MTRLAHLQLSYWRLPHAIRPVVATWPVRQAISWIHFFKPPSDNDGVGLLIPEMRLFSLRLHKKVEFFLVLLVQFLDGVAGSYNTQRIPLTLASNAVH
jgi:hypothetical protein